MIYYKDGQKMMLPVLNKEEYMAIRNGGEQKDRVKRIRSGEESLKTKLVQMNYSCLPNEDGTLKGSTRMSTTVGMDIDHIKAEDMQAVKERILSKAQELGLLMLEESARGAGYHLAFKRHPELSQEDNLRWASNLLEVEYDAGAKDITRVFFTTTAAQLVYLDDAVFQIKEQGARSKEQEDSAATSGDTLNSKLTTDSQLSTIDSQLEYNGLPYKDIIRKWWELYNEGKEPFKTNRDVLTFELAVNLRHICGFDRELMDAVIPCYDGFSETQKMKCIDSALSEKRTQMPKRLKDVLFEVRRDRMNSLTPNPSPNGEGSDYTSLDEAVQEDERFYYNRLPRMPQGVRESIEAVGPSLSMPVVTAICPAIGMLATGVQLDVHGQKKGLNLISYIAGDFASGKGSIDPVIDAWLGEVKALDIMYQQQEEDWRRKSVPPRTRRNNLRSRNYPCVVCR